MVVRYVVRAPTKTSIGTRPYLFPRPASALSTRVGREHAWGVYTFNAGGG